MRRLFLKACSLLLLILLLPSLSGQVQAALEGLAKLTKSGSTPAETKEKK